MERQLVSVRTISELKPIPGADLIELAVVDGWQCVVKKGEYAVGDLALYFEIDSWVPHDIAPFLSKGKEPREYKGVKGERLRTVKLKGQISQGLLLPINEALYAINLNVDPQLINNTPIYKYEKELPANLRGLAKPTEKG